MDERLRPLTLGEILDRTAQFYRRNFFTFAAVAAVPMLAIFAVVVPFVIALGYMGLFNPKAATPSVSAMVALFITGLLIGLPALIVASVLEQAALTKTAIAVHRGQKIQIREALKSVWPRFWRYFGLLFLKGLAVGGVPAAIATLLLGGLTAITALSLGSGAKDAAFFVGILTVFVFIAAIVYAIWAETCFSLGLSACIVEEKSAWQSIKRTFRLTKGTRGRIFVLYLLVFAIYMVVSIVIDVIVLIGVGLITYFAHSHAPLLLVVAQILNFAASFAIQTLIAPVSVIALVLFYYDQRVRTEGYDIELMMEQAGLSAQPAPSAAPAESAPPAPGQPSNDVPFPESPLKPAPENPWALQSDPPAASAFEPHPGPDTVKEP